MPDNYVNEYSTWLEIDLGAIRENVHQLLELSNTQIMAVVKANGYGHGALEVARAASEAGATWCGVARLDEALNLRRAGINTRILVLGFTPPDRIPDAIANNVTLTVYDPDIANAYADRSKAVNQVVRVHVKVDTGMGRLGLAPDEALMVMQHLEALQGLEVEGIFTHFARADEPHLPATGTQLQRFDQLLAALDQAGIRPKLVHASNSSGTLFFPDSRYDLVRPGIAILGLAPSPESPLPSGFRPALTWKARLTSKKKLPPRHGISYGHAYITETAEWIGVVPVGYADGFRRTPDNLVLVGGQRVPVVGNISMDQTMIRLNDVPEAEIGSEVVLIGEQGSAAIGAHEIARRWGTITYEVICGLADRLPRIYLNKRN